MNHQSTLDGLGVWQPGIRAARQWQQRGGPAVVYCHVSLRETLDRPAEATFSLLNFEGFTYQARVIIPLGGDPVYQYGLDSQLPAHYVRAILEVEKENHLR